MKNRIKNSVYSVVKNPWILVVLVAVFLLFAGILAITQETDGESVLDEILLDDMLAGFSGEDMEEEELPPVWEPPGPPRWFRSNAGGMTLEEIPSRLAALRNRYALVIDYLPPDEIEPRLLPYYHDEYTVEIRTLYEQGAEVRRQWLFRDELGVARLNAVFIPPPAVLQPEEQPEEQPDETEEAITLTDDDDIIDNNIVDNNISDNYINNNIEEIAELTGERQADSLMEPVQEPAVEAAPARRDAPLSVGFIEIFNEKTQITEERQFFDDDSEILINYFYNLNILVRAEAGEKSPGGELRTAYVDNYRYNRSYSLRHVERQFHQYEPGAPYTQPIRLTFPGRVLDAAFDDSFMSDKLTIISDFLSGFSANEGWRVIYQTDGKGRILTQTMLDDKDEEVWVMINTWSGDRIVAMQKIEGEDEKVTEYEYNSEGDRIVQRDIHNGVLERLVRTDGANETEELYLGGILVMKAYWVDGRKVSEERVRRR